MIKLIFIFCSSCIILNLLKLHSIQVPDKLQDASHVTHMYAITPTIGALCIGSNPDCKVVVLQARQIAAKFKDQNGYPIPVHFLASKVGKKAQIFTQHAGVRPLSCVMHLCAIDDEKGSQLYFS